MSAPKVYEAINRITALMAKEGIAKSRQNQQQKYAFRGIDDVYAALSSALAENKLCILPRVLSRSVTERETRNGGVLFYTALEVDFDFVSSEDGSTHTVRTVGEAMDSADKSSNKAMSAAYKYACLQAFCIPTVGDNDADATTHDVAAKRQPAPQPPTKEEISTLTHTLEKAAEHGTEHFRRVWAENAGPVRTALLADQDTMDLLQDACTQADRRIANAEQQAQDDADAARARQEEEQKQQEGV